VALTQVIKVENFFLLCFVFNIARKKQAIIFFNTTLKQFLAESNGIQYFLATFSGNSQRKKSDIYVSMRPIQYIVQQ
jgi:hypothetical protein